MIGPSTSLTQEKRTYSSSIKERTFQRRSKNYEEAYQCALRMVFESLGAFMA
jgi:hypothetical protein